MTFQSILTKVKDVDQKYFERKINGWLDEIKKLVEEFKLFREEKNWIKTIKEKSEIIKVVSRDKWDRLDQLFQRLVLKNNQSGNQLRYSKYKTLDLSNIKKINASCLELEVMSSWLSKCHNLSFLELRRNNLT